MKVLGISAGRHNGNSDIAVKEALLACQEKGAEVIFINLFDYSFTVIDCFDYCSFTVSLQVE